MATGKRVNAEGRQKRRGAARKPRLGQHFLADRSAAERIVNALGDIGKDVVLEIGPGTGALTGILAQRAGHLIALELDRMLAARLRLKFSQVPSLEVVEADVLRADFATVLRSNAGLLRDRSQMGPRKTQVVGNLPYYIASQILLRLFEDHRLFERIVIMVQKEVADRLAAKPGSRDYGLLTATAQLFARVEKLFTLPPGAFSPPPKVHSTVLRLTIAPRAEELRVDADQFQRFLRLAFAHKRKTLFNNLRGQYGDQAVRKALSAARTRPDLRAEALSLDKMAAIFRTLGGA